MTNIRYAPPPPPFLAESAPMMIVIRMRSLYTINDFLRIYVVPPDIKQKVILWKFCRGSLGMCSNKYNFQGWREGKSRGAGEVLSGARQQTPLSASASSPKGCNWQIDDAIPYVLCWSHTVGGCNGQESYFHIFCPNLGNRNYQGEVVTDFSWTLFC